MNSVDQHNARAWDDLVRQGTSFANPARPEDFREPERIINPFGWLPSAMRGLRVLCLAAGGGRHGPIFAAQGADVLVVDISEEMLRLDREVAARENVELKTLRTTMTDLSACGDGVFDIVLQPVSTCYVEDLGAVYGEVARVLKSGGTYVSQHKQPISLQCASEPLANGAYPVCEPYFREGPLPPVAGREHRESGTDEFLHSWDDLLGGLCRQGFTIEDFREPRHADAQAPPGSFRHRSHFVPPYLAIKAVRRNDVGSTEGSVLWTPG